MIAQNHHRRLTVVVLAAAALALVGCTAPSADRPSSGAAHPDSAETAPGTVLNLGKAATLGYSVAGGNGSATIAVTAIEHGNAADLTGVDLQSDAGKTPWYVRYTVSNKGSVDAQPAGFASNLSAVTSQGTQLVRIIVLGTIKQCEDTLADQSFPPGAEKQACDIFLADPATAVTEVRYQPPTGPLADNPIVWRP